MVKRGFDVISIGSQSFEQRFPGKRRRLDDDIPRLSGWRCNLTGLSVSHNFYFVAYGSDIYVYEPQHPSQAIAEPVLIIPSTPSAVNLPSHLDHTHPNAINALLVSFLGTEEAVATVRDDGDVDVFLVRHIAHAVQLRCKATEQLSLVADQVRPVFQRNVGASAWGLAIHSEARVIGVSSNSHEVTIFRFGLVGDLGTTEYGDIVDEHRQFDAYQCIANGEANIPCIAFCNTGDDPKARWLLTTDINGICRTIDVHRLAVTQSFTFGRQPVSFYGGGYNRINAGWTMMFLDRRSFAPEDDLYGALGLEEDETLPDARDSPHIWDLSRTIRSLVGVSTAFIDHSKKHDRHLRTTLSSMQAVPPVRQHEDTSSRATSTETEHAQEVVEEIGVTTDTSLLEDSDESEGPLSTSIDVDLVDDDLDDYEDEQTEDTTPPSAYYGGERICGNVPRFSPLGSFCDNLPCPIFHASVRNVYLLQPTSAPFEEQGKRLLIGMAAPLRQPIEMSYHALNIFERLNMSVYLPSLGIIIVASQKGRVLVMALTKLSRSVKYPQGLDRFGNQTNYSMRVEAILPTARQEKDKKRPFAPLHGISAGPMPGTESSIERKKRWRLLLMYQDHSMLSYEIKKRGHVDATEPANILV